MAFDSSTTPADAQQPGPWLRLRGLLPMGLTAILLAAGLTCYGTMMAYRSGVPVSQAMLWTLTMMTIGLAGSILALGWYNDRWRVLAFQRQLARLTESERVAPIVLSGAGELSGLVVAINGYVAQLQNRTARLQLQKKELDIQTRIIEAEMRCVETVVAKITDPVIVTDAFDDVVLTNIAAQKVLGFALGAAQRQAVHRAIANPGIVKLIKSMRSADQPAQRTYKVCLNPETARPENYLISLTRVTDPRGHIHGVVTVLRSASQAVGAGAKQAGR
jgi:signal transduction histidine kinase